jgi:hypothetical protein
VELCGCGLFGISGRPPGTAGSVAVGVTVGPVAVVGLGFGIIGVFVSVTTKGVSVSGTGGTLQELKPMQASVNTTKKPLKRCFTLLSFQENE